jgi:hypothetical protein
MVTAMEDTGALQALIFLSRAGRVDLGRALVLRTVSNYDRQAPGVTAAESLKQWWKAITTLMGNRSRRQSGWAIEWLAISSSPGPNASRRFLRHGRANKHDEARTHLRRDACRRRCAGP